MGDKKAAKQGEGESDRIRVYVRVRPRSAEEASRDYSFGVDVEPERSEVALYDARERRYKFDKIFPPEATNKEVFNTVGKPLVDAVFSGFNGTIMAYGQTGTGKTFTVMSVDGICVAAVEKLFKRVHLDSYHDYKVYMSYLQIYQEKIYDLLNTSSKVDLILREDPQKGVYVENLSEFVVRNTSEVLSLLRLGKKKLVFGETRMNRFSSRSHSVCQITVERSRAKSGENAGVSNDSSQLSNLSTRKSCKPVRSTGSLDRLHEKSKIPQRTRSTPSRVGALRQQNFAPRKTSTPKPTGSLSRKGVNRYSLHLSSLPEVTSTPIRPKRWSMGELMPSGLLESNESLPNSPSGSEGSDLQFRMDFEVESGSESEGWKGPDSPDIPEFDLGEDEDDDETFLEDIRIHEDILITGTINICDLAGSERIKKAGVEGGERLSELQTVNLSLLELGNTIHALSEGKRTHIPYRNSSLTRLLQDSLGGNCKTSFVMCISPLLRDVPESRCTLDFGQRALKITTTAYVNVDVDYVKLSADLRKRVEIQDLEIKAQKENFEKQSYAIKSDAEAKLAEIEALLEAERDRYKIEIKTLQLENDKLSKALFDERSQRRAIEGTHHASLEAALLMERQRILSQEELERRRLQSALEDEKSRFLVKERRAKGEYERALEEGKRRSGLLKELQQESFEKSLEQERQRVSELEERSAKSPSHERYTQTVTMLDQPEFPRISPANNQTDTLYNVLLAEIMSLQLLYQMQDLSRACSSDDPQSRDSGCPEYDDVVIQSVSSSVLEKGGLLLNNLRGRQRGDSRFSLTSTDSLRELYLLHFPPSPKLSLKSEKTGSVPFIPLKSSCPELRSDSKKSFSSNDSETVRAPDGTSSSSMESFLEEEPMSPRSRSRPTDSGCSSQNSDSERSPSGRQASPPIDINGRDRAYSNPVRRTNMSACVPLAEEEDGDLEIVDGFEADEIQSVKNKVVHLEKDLCRLKSELDSETVSFFSEVFGVQLPFRHERELSRVMRHLFEGVKEKLLLRIVGQSQENHEDHDDGHELDLVPPLLEEAVNLLLVSKTVMSCLLVLQNRRDVGNTPEPTTSVAEMPTVIHVQPKVDQEVQTDPEPIRSLRRRIRKDTGVVTDPQVKIQVRDEECQTSKEEIVVGSLNAKKESPEKWTPAQNGRRWGAILSSRSTIYEKHEKIEGCEQCSLPVISAYQEESFETIIKAEPWPSHCESDLEQGFHDDSELLPSRDPDGASRAETPADFDNNIGKLDERASEVMSSTEDVDLKDAKKVTKKNRLFSCISPARLSVRRKSKRGETKHSKSDTTGLVKEI